MTLDNEQMRRKLLRAARAIHNNHSCRWHVISSDGSGVDFSTNKLGKIKLRSISFLLPTI
jgi:hypothetical protein